MSKTTKKTPKTGPQTRRGRPPTVQQTPAAATQTSPTRQPTVQVTFALDDIINAVASPSPYSSPERTSSPTQKRPSHTHAPTSRLLATAASRSQSRLPLHTPTRTPSRGRSTTRVSPPEHVQSRSVSELLDRTTAIVHDQIPVNSNQTAVIMAQPVQLINNSHLPVL